MGKEIKVLCIHPVIMSGTGVEAFTKDKIYCGRENGTSGYQLTNNSGNPGHSCGIEFFDKYFVLIDEKNGVNLKCINSIKSEDKEVFIKGRTYGIKISNGTLSCIDSRGKLRTLPLAFMNKHFKPLREVRDE